MSATKGDTFRVVGQPKFSMIPLSVIDLAPSARAVQVFAVLAAHAHNDDRRCWPGIRRISDKAKCSTERARAAIADLERAGLIAVTKGDPRAGTSSVYDLSPAWAMSSGGGVGDGPPRVGDGPPRTRGVPFSSRKTPSVEDSPELAATITAVVDHWRATLAPRAKDTEPRRRRVRARIREGYTEAELIKAIDGCKSSAWHQERHLTDLELITRSAAHVDRFIELLSDHRSGARGSGTGGRPAATARTGLSRDELALNDVMQAMANATSEEERLELAGDAENIRARIRAACDTPDATRTDTKG